VVWPATVPLIVGATVPAVAMTVVMLLAVALAPAVSMSVMVKVVVTVPPGANLMGGGGEHQPVQRCCDRGDSVGIGIDPGGGVCSCRRPDCSECRSPSRTA